MFNLKRTLLSLILSSLLIITFFIPTSFIRAVSSPLRDMGKLYPLTLTLNGSESAGIKGYEFEYVYLPTSEWTTIGLDP